MAKTSCCKRVDQHGRPFEVFVTRPRLAAEDKRI